VSEPEPEVRAAGGVVVRPEPGSLRIAVVHRPRYDDWSLPKGKLLDDESFQDAARREVLEETGLTVRLGAELDPVSYRDRHGRRKIVRYFRMVAAGGAFAPNDEVDEVRWLAPEDAIRVLSYPHDRELIRSLGEP
jgi:8-oxo-dGTP diphosphatase